MSKRKWIDEQLVSAVKNNISMRQVLISLGLCGRGGGSYRKVRQRIKELSLDTSHWLGCAHLKNKSHNWTKSIPLKAILIEDSDYNSTHTLKRRLLKEGLLIYKCYKCEIIDWLSAKISLQLDHINGNHRDHRIENLRFLCPNCHSQTETFAGRNKKKLVVAPTGLAPARSKRAIDFESILSANSITVPKICIECPTKITNKSTRCKKCASKYRKQNKEKIVWPSKDELLKLLETNSFLGLSRILGVTDNAIRKHLKNH